MLNFNKQLFLSPPETAGRPTEINFHTKERQER